jgi:hypothetical protein
LLQELEEEERKNAKEAQKEKFEELDAQRPLTQDEKDFMLPIK